MKQLEGQDITDIENAKLQPTDMGLLALKKIGAKGLTDMASYISDNHLFIVNRFIRARVAGALDVHYNGDQPHEGTGDSDESGQDDSDESGQDDSDETKEEETDDDNDDEDSVINSISEEDKIGDQDKHELDEEDNVYEDGHGVVVELKSEKESN